ncbi:LOW QUALITY PROTEIN: uncharacterized protein [Amphiura filiformis]|uniref:LOW QUALITY PROTEIN: uncharacterized protein n=1 Tax=Amphiura filiformis TaxID=82378 RepID=UPI003B2209F3
MVLSIRMRSFNRKKPCDVAERENDSPENDEDTPSTSSAHTPSTSSARWARNRREKLKQDPEARKKFLASEAARQRERRAKRTEKQRERDRETGRIRQQRYEKRLSEGAVESAKGKRKTKEKKSKVLTRTEKKKKTEYNRIKQQERRARMNPQQKRRAREIDAKRRSEKRKENQGKQCPVNSTPPRTSSGFISKSAQRMAFKRLWERFPINDPEKFASIVEDFVSGKHTTPRKQAALQRRGIGVLSAKRTLQLGKCMTDSVKRRVQELKKKDSASLKERRLLVRANLISKKYRMQSHLAKQLDVRPNYLSELSKSLDEDMMSKSRKRRSDATSMEVINEIQSFYRLPKVSRELPYMRTVKQQTQRRVMEVSIDQAYTMWKEEHPDHVTVVSRFSLFQKLRPENVLLQHRNKLNQCLCVLY